LPFEGEVAREPFGLRAFLFCTEARSLRSQ